MLDRTVAVLLAATFLGSASAQAAPVFETDFESGMPIELTTGDGVLEPVQGFAGLGPSGSQFGGQFLRNASTNATILTLTGLPAHSAIDIEFLLAVIDSWDGSSAGFPSGDFFTVTVDGVPIFTESFVNSQAGFTQTYVAPSGGELAYKQNLGFTVGFHHSDSAYDMALEPSFQGVPHSASTLTVVFSGSGTGYQGGTDESWAIDQLRVSLVPEPGALFLLVSGALSATAMARRSRRS